MALRGTSQRQLDKFGSDVWSQLYGDGDPAHRKRGTRICKMFFCDDAIGDDGKVPFDSQNVCGTPVRLDYFSLQLAANGYLVSNLVWVCQIQHQSGECIA